MFRNRPLNIIGHKGHVPVRSMNYICCSLLGISKLGVPMSIEILLEKVKNPDLENSNVQQSEKVKGIHYYLQMRRNNYRIPNEFVEDPRVLEVGRITAAQMKEIPGIYRIWNFNWSGQIVQSRFTIAKDFTATLETVLTREGESQQKCLMSVSSIRNKTLCVASHPFYICI